MPREQLACLLHLENEATRDPDHRATGNPNPAGCRIYIWTRCNNARPGKQHGAAHVEEERVAHNQKTSADGRTNGTRDSTTRRSTVDRSQTEVMHNEGKAGQTGADNKTSQPFSESVLRTEHDHVSQYARLGTGLLLAINRQVKATDQPKANTYHKWVHLRGPQGEKVWMHSVIDGSAMLNTLCTSKWKRQRDRLTPLELSDVILSIADNHKIASEGRWTGIVEVADAQVTQ